MGVCLSRCGVVTSHLPGATHCWHHDKSEGHVIRAEELANGLRGYHLGGMQKLVKKTGKDFKKELRSKKGIIFFKDYWRRGKESYRNRSGDHIDLWNGYRLTDWKTWARIQFNLSWEGVWSDYRKSKEIWFWGVM